MYYTTEIDQSKAGAITFKDKKSGSKVTLQCLRLKRFLKRILRRASRRRQPRQLKQLRHLLQHQPLRLRLRPRRRLPI